MMKHFIYARKINHTTHNLALWYDLAEVDKDAKNCQFFDSAMNMENYLKSLANSLNAEW